MAQMLKAVSPSGKEMLIDPLSAGSLRALGWKVDYEHPVTSDETPESQVEAEVEPSGEKASDVAEKPEAEPELQEEAQEKPKAPARRSKAK